MPARGIEFEAMQSVGLDNWKFSKTLSVFCRSRRNKACYLRCELFDLVIQAHQLIAELARGESKRFLLVPRIQKCTHGVARKIRNTSRSGSGTQLS
jgi:hypothetical protein